MPLPSLSINIPAITGIESLVRKASDPFDVSSEEEMIEQAAKKQVTEERGEESLFWKVLEAIGRPQAAVAGVLTDLIDGGDFSPLDRIGKALAGKEHTRMKDFIDVISPGKWSQMKMPDFLGGKEADWAKEAVGFLGDIFTDPLMATRTFSLMKGIHPITGEHLKVLSKWSRWGDDVIKKEAQLAGESLIKARGVAHEIGTNFLMRRGRLNKLKSMWIDATSRPDEFMRKYIPEGKQFEFADDIKMYMGQQFAKPTRVQQLLEQQRSMLSFVVPFAKSLGIKQAQFPLIPKFADDLAAAVGTGITKMYEGVAMSDTGHRFLDSARKMFRYGSGSPVEEYWSLVTASKARQLDQTNEQNVKAFGKILGKYTTEEQVAIGKAAEQPLKDWGLTHRGYGERLEEIPENLREGVEGIHERVDGLLNRERANPLTEFQGITREPLTPRRAHALMMKEVKEESPVLYKYLSSYSKMKKQANDFIKAQKKSLSPEESRLLYKDKMEDLVQLDLLKGASFISRSIPKKPMGYLPHEMTPEAASVFMKLFRDPAIKHSSGVGLYDYVIENVRHRVPGFRDFTAAGFNEAFRLGQINWDVLDTFKEQAFKVLKGGKKAKFNWWMKQLDPDSLKFWIEDPQQLLAHRAMNSTKAVTRADYLRGSIGTSARRLQLNDMPVPMFGETPVLLSKKGMDAIEGRSWRAAHPERAEAYDAFVKERRLDPENEMSGIFLKADADTLVKAHGLGVPVFAIPTSELKSIADKMKIYESPEKWNYFLDLYDKSTNWFKATSLAIFPAYHARNVISGFWQAFLGDSLLDAKSYEESIGFLRASGQWAAGSTDFAQGTAKIFGKAMLGKPGRALDDFAMDLGNGVIYTAEKQLEDMHSFGVFAGFYATEMKDAAMGRVNKEAQGMLRKVGREFTQYGETIKTGFWVGNYFDNMHRVAHYRSMIKQGKTPFEAAMSVKKHFFNYDELTQFERTWLRRVMPFYTWTRKNIPLQLEAMITQPGKYGQLGRMVDMLQTDEVKNMDPALLPKWVNEQFGVPTRVNKKTGDMEVMMLRSWIPAMDLMSVVHTNPVHAAIRTVTSLAHPIPKGLLEQHINKSFYTGKQIEDFPGEPYPGGFLGLPMSKRLVHAFKTLRLPAEIERLRRKDIEGSELTMAQRFAGASGMFPKTKAFDVAQLESRLKYDVAKRKGELRRKYNTAKKFKDKHLIKYYKDMLEDVSRSKK